MSGEAKKAHDELVQFVARNRFDYPSEQSPNLRTYVNAPQISWSLSVSYTESLSPDIVVADKETKKATTIAEVETQTTIDNESAIAWKKYSTIRYTNFYLYVPQSCLLPVRRLIDFFSVRVTALRIYTISDHYEPIITPVRS